MNAIPDILPPTATDSEPVAFWRHPRAPLAAVFVLAVAHFLWLHAHLAPAIMSPDANGYVVQARLLAESGRTSFSATSPVQFIGMHWLETDRGVFHSRYPAGLPLLFAGAWKLGGLDAALLVNPLLASATLLLVFFLARRITGDWPAGLAAAVVALVPVANQHALDADAHIAATFFLVGGVLALLRFATAWRPGWGLLAGALLGIVPTVRYPEAIVGLAIGAWLLWQARPVWRAWPAVAGAALPLLPLCVHNAAAYGAFWRTGYALTNEQTGFGLNYFAAHAVPYLQALGGSSLGVFFAFGAAGLAALAVEPARRAVGALFAGIVVPVALLYMAYYFGGVGGGGGAAMGNMRFLIPTFPFFAIGGAWLLAEIAGHLGRSGRSAVAVVVGLHLLVALSGSAQALAQSASSIGAAARARALAETEFPAGSVLIVDRNLAESLDAVGRWRIVEENLVSAMGLRGAPGGMMRPPAGPEGEDGDDRPNPQQAGKNRAQQVRYAGLAVGARRTLIWADIAAWAGDRPVYWFARSLDQVENALPAGGDYTSVAEIDAPAMGGMGRPGGAVGPGAARGGRAGRGQNFAPLGGGRGAFGPPGMGGPPGMPGAGVFPGGAGAPTKLRVVKLSLPKG